MIGREGDSCYQSTFSHPQIMSLPDKSKINRPRTVVIPCSGNNSNGEIGDRIARRLQEEGLAEMMSVAQINAKITASSRLAVAPRILAINGCHSSCASECLESLGYSDFEVWDVKEHLDLNGNPMTEADIELAVAKVKELLNR